MAASAAGKSTTLDIVTYRGEREVKTYPVACGELTVIVCVSQRDPALRRFEKC